jgi:hypothetical protein
MKPLGDQDEQLIPEKETGERRRGETEIERQRQRQRETERGRGGGSLVREHGLESLDLLEVEASLDEMILRRAVGASLAQHRLQLSLNALRKGKSFFLCLDLHVPARVRPAWQRGEGEGGSMDSSHGTRPGHWISET